MRLGGGRDRPRCAPPAARIGRNALRSRRSQRQVRPGLVKRLRAATAGTRLERISPVFCRRWQGSAEMRLGGGRDRPKCTPPRPAPRVSPGHAAPTGSGPRTRSAFRPISATAARIGRNALGGWQGSLEMRSARGRDRSKCAPPAAGIARNALKATLQAGNRDKARNEDFASPPASPSPHRPPLRRPSARRGPRLFRTTPALVRCA